MRRLPSIAIALVAVAAAAGCGSSDSTPPPRLTAHLLPATAYPGFGLERTIELRDPIDLVAEGIALPQATQPSTAVRRVRDAQLQAAKGQVFKRGSGLDAVEFHLGVARLGSASRAAALRDWMHEQDLQQPCFSACIFAPAAMRLQRVPRSTAVIQTVASGKPSAPANYRAEFTIGPYLYWAWGQFDGTAETRQRFEQGVELYYRHARSVI